MGFIAIDNFRISGTTLSSLITGITEGQTTLTDNDNTLVTERAIKSYIDAQSGGASVTDPFLNALIISDGTPTGITANSNLLYEDNSLKLNNTLETFASGQTITSGTTNIVLSTTGTTNIMIEYKATRNINFMSGNIEIIYDVSGTTLYIDDSEYSITNDIGLTFDADINSGFIRLNLIVTNDTYDIDFKYIRKIIK